MLYLMITDYSIVVVRSNNYKRKMRSVQVLTDDPLSISTTLVDYKPCYTNQSIQKLSVFIVTIHSYSLSKCIHAIA